MEQVDPLCAIRKAIDQAEVCAWDLRSFLATDASAEQDGPFLRLVRSLHQARNELDAATELGETQAARALEIELLKLNREKAIGVIARALKQLSDQSTNLAIAAVFARSASPVELELLAPAHSSCAEDVLETLDAGSQFGRCEGCGVSLRSLYKTVACPLCGSQANLT
jgi:rubrerythrin